MKRSLGDRERLLHIIDAIESIDTFLESMDYDEFIKSKLHTSATIHHMIYKVVPSENETVILENRINLNREYCIFIVDEASMISDRANREGGFKTPNSLLHDLLQYVKQGNSRNKVVFIGDQYQLAPVFETNSVALDLCYFRKEFSMSGREVELSEVKRQKEDSKILTKANKIKTTINNSGTFCLNNNMSIFHNQKGAVTSYMNLYQPFNQQAVTMIGFKKAHVYEFNQKIRQRMGLTGFLAIGDQVMVNQNWFSDQRTIMKREIGIVTEIHNAVEKRVGLEFLTVTITFSNKNQQPIRAKTKVLVDTLKDSDSDICNNLLNKLIGIQKTKNQIFRESPYPFNDAYVGAMRLRYGHGLTGYSAARWRMG